MLGVELAVDVPDLAHERAARPPRPSGTRQPARAPGTSPHATASERSAIDTSSTAQQPGTRPCISSTQPATSRAIGPAWSNDGASGNTPSIGTSPYVGLNPVDAAAGGRDADRAAGVRAERRVGQAEHERRRRAARRAARRATGERRVRDGAVVEVLRRDAVGELVQVRLADVRPPGALESQHGLGRPFRHVLGEHRRAVGRADAGRVEEILDGEPPARRAVGEPGDEDALYESQR